MTRFTLPLALTLAAGLAACESSKPTAPTAESSPAATDRSAKTEPSASAKPEVDPRVVYSRQLAMRFGKTLKGALQEGMSKGGPVKAIEVCSVQAPEIAGKIDKKDGWQIGRTSLKPRNVDNAPDDWERAVLERFEKRKAAGTKPEQLEEHAVIESDGKKVFRYMKAIPTAALCLDCHGKSLAQETVKALDARYPEDQARGFDIGDIRGAFSVQKAL